MLHWTTSLLIHGVLTGALFAAPRFDTVVIDPGHGGLDSGAIWYGTQEKDLTLPVSKLLRDELRTRGIQKVLMTRDTDVIMGLSERAEFANQQKRPIFVSIHFNANLDSDVTGIESYVMPNAGTAKELGAALGGPLKAMGRRYLGVKTFNLKVLRETNHPAIVIEGGFLSNRGENWLIRTDDYQRKLASAIADGILAYRDSAGGPPAREMVAKADPQPVPKPVPMPQLEPVPPSKLPNPAPPKPVPPPRPTPPAAPSPPEDFRVQFGAFSMPKYASNLQAELKGKGLDVFVRRRQGKTMAFHCVVSQRTFADANSAARWADQLVQKKVVETTAVTR